MLTDEQIEKYLYKYAQLQDELSSYIVQTIAKRVNDIGKLTSISEINSLEQITRTNEDIKNIKSTINRTRKKQKEQIDEDFWDLVVFMYFEAQQFYEKGQMLLAENAEILKALEKLQAEAKQNLDALTKNPVIVLRDLKNPARLKVYSIDAAYKSIVQEASQYALLKNIDTKVALKRTETQLFDSGVRFRDNDSPEGEEKTLSANRAIRFNVLGSIKNLVNRIQDIMGKQFGANGLELSAHIYPAPDHAPAQGHQFTKEEVDKIQSGEDFKDVDGNSYAGFERQIGQWNCRHYFMKIKLGAKPQYTQEQLDKILADNEKGYTTPDGKHYTLYQCTQIQRRYERNIRNAKQQYLFAKATGDKDTMATLRGRVGSLTLQYKQFSRACDIPAKMERIKVKDY